jgi:hypothetical protein
VGVTPRVELTIDELVLDGFEELPDAVEAIRDELRSRLGPSLPGQFAGRLEPVAAEVVKAAEQEPRR